MASANRSSSWSSGEGLAAAGDLTGYAVEARDGEIGKVDKHDVESGTTHLIVSTGPWIFGRTVMLPAGVIERIDHDTRVVVVSCSREQVKNAPEYPEEHDDEQRRHHASALADYYGDLRAPPAPSIPARDE